MFTYGRPPVTGGEDPCVLSTIGDRAGLARHRSSPVARRKELL